MTAVTVATLTQQVALTVASSSGDLNPLVPHPLEIALIGVVVAVALLPLLAVVVWGLVLLKQQRITLWPTFTVCVALALVVPCLGALISLAVLAIRRNELSPPTA